MIGAKMLSWVLFSMGDQNNIISIKAFKYSYIA